MVEKHNTLANNTLIDIAEQLTQEAIDNLKRMIELGKKPDGQKLSNEDRQSCMEVVILWEAKHLSETERSGYIAQQCKIKNSEEEKDSLVQTLMMQS